MFGNNINGPFMSPNMSYGSMIGRTPMMNTASMGMRSAPMMGMGSSSMIGGAPRTGGFLSSLLGLGGRGAGGLRSFNFGSLLNNASKALGVVNQAIPIVKEVGPMVGNMKSMLKIASVFKDETDTSTSSRNTSSSATTTNTNVNSNTTTNEDTSTNENDTRRSSTTTNQTLTSEPNFFL